jgi:hypothetical protein
MGEQVAMQQPPQAIAHDRTLVDLGADDEGAAPRAWLRSLIGGRQQGVIGRQHAQQQVGAVVPPAEAMQLVDGPMAP